MNTFEKTYIISYVKNIDKQHRIKLMLNELHIDNYEFIYGIDMHISDICKTSIWDEKDSQHFIITDNNPDSYASHAISCSIAHITALQHAYYSNFQNCLIIEDDVLLYKNNEYVNKVLNYYPKDADIIQYGYILFYYDNNIKYDENYNIGEWYGGTQCYGVCNRNSMKILIDNYLQTFYEADNYNLYKNLIIYNTNIPIFIDPCHKSYNANILDYN